MNSECIFCRIVADEASAKKVYQDDQIVAFHDINPMAPVHILIVPCKHISNLLQASKQDSEVLGKMLLLASDLARKFQVAETGFRIVINTNRYAGQSVDHLHLHLLGGRIMEWPPG